MSGARPLAITDCLNFGNPENPEVMWQFAKATDGIKEACIALNTPVVSGNVSLYNETEGKSIYPTPTVVMVGVNDDENKVLASTFSGEGKTLYIVGATKSDFGGSLYLKEVYGKIEGTLPPIDYKQELALWDLVIEANKAGIISAAKDVNVGGIAIALSKMAAVSNIGVEAKITLNDSKDIFSETFSRAIVEVSDDATFINMATQRGLFVEKIATTGGDSVKVNDIEISLKKLREIYFNTFKKVIEQDI